MKKQILINNAKQKKNFRYEYDNMFFRSNFNIIN